MIGRDQERNCRADSSITQRTCPAADRKASTLSSDDRRPARASDIELLLFMIARGHDRSSRREDRGIAPVSSALGCVSQSTLPKSHCRRAGLFEVQLDQPGRQPHGFVHTQLARFVEANVPVIAQCSRSLDVIQPSVSRRSFGSSALSWRPTPRPQTPRGTQQECHRARAHEVRARCRRGQIDGGACKRDSCWDQAD